MISEARKNHELPTLSDAAVSLRAAFLLVVAGIAVGGCAMVDPQRSKALSEEEQSKIMKEDHDVLVKQLAAQERTAAASERQAAALEKLSSRGEKLGGGQ